MEFSAFMATEFWGNTGEQYVIAMLIFVIIASVLKIFKTFGINRLRRFTQQTKTHIDDVLVDFLDSIRWPFFFVLALYISLRFLFLTAKVDRTFYFVMLLFAAYYCVRFGQLIVDITARRMIAKKGKEVDNQDKVAIHLIGLLVKVALWIIALIFIISNLGYNISSLVAGLGIGGIAIALAIQNVLGDIFSAFSIYLDKPFELGDFIIIGNDMGTVEKVGIKSTRIRTLQGEELVVSNRELTSTRIQNFKKMAKRRVYFDIGVVYNTPNKKLKKIPDLIIDIINKEELAEPDRVHFRSFGDFSLNFEIVYFINSSEYRVYMDTREDINLAIKEAFEKEKIEFAYPTQKVFLAK